MDGYRESERIMCCGHVAEEVSVKHVNGGSIVGYRCWTCGGYLKRWKPAAKTVTYHGLDRMSESA